MTTIDFFSTIRFNNNSVYCCVDSVLEFAEEFSDFGVRKTYSDGTVYSVLRSIAHVLPGRTDTGNIPVVVKSYNAHLYPLWGKVTACVLSIGIFPLLMLITKAFLRCFYTFEKQGTPLYYQVPSDSEEDSSSDDDISFQRTNSQASGQNNVTHSFQERSNALNAFHTKAQITHENRFKQIAINDATFSGLDLNEKATVPVRQFAIEPGNEHIINCKTNYTYTLKTVANDVVCLINIALEKKRKDSFLAQEPLPSCRSVLLYEPSLRLYANLGGPAVITNSEEANLRWIPRILAALVQTGLIFSFRQTEQGYLIQA